MASSLTYQNMSAVLPWALAVFVVMVALLVLMPFSAYAQAYPGDCRADSGSGVLSGLVPCGCDTHTIKRVELANGNVDYKVEGASPDGVVSGPERCGFDKLIQLIQNVITWIILFTIPVAAIMFSYAGFLMITAQGDEGKITQGKQIFWYVFVGFLFVLSSWLIVYTIATVLLDGQYIQFLKP
ncbi:MAG: pilin [Candidatus Paceibacterota bacterium]